MRPIFEPVMQALQAGGVRYVIVGGVAVVLQGYVRATADLDLMVDLVADESGKAIEALTALGLRPRAPVDAKDFADPEKRDQWTREKGMKVFSMFDPSNPMREVDLFVENPMDFEDVWKRAKLMDINGTPARVASIGDLIELKRISGRPKDLADIEELKALSELGEE